jgi:hypothetical protein
MLSPHILVIGNSTKRIEEYLSTHRYAHTILQDRNTYNAIGVRESIVRADFRDILGVLDAVDTIHARKPISGVMVMYEQFVTMAALVARYLGLPGLPLGAAADCTDKIRMRQKFSTAPHKISPDFAVLHTVDDLVRFAQSHTFPLIIKPANLSKSLLVSKSSSLVELLHNYAKTQASTSTVYAAYAPRSQPRLLIEEYMDGSVHSVDAFIDNHGIVHVLDAVIDYQTGYDIGYADNFHYSRLTPTRLSAGAVEAIKRVAVQGCQALGMRNTPAHIEIILTEDGPRIVEIAARNGGYRDRMHGQAHGIAIIGNTVRLSLGQQPIITAARNEAMGVFELFPKVPGLFAGITHEQALRALPSFNYLSIKPKVGSFVGSSSDGFKMCAVVMLHNADHEQFRQDVAFLNNYVMVKTVAA